ncbi:MAG TPA: D-2-hydroxyacid dehydrogenase [Spirochaetota bacterium]|nr:D-2-hydroxyacid dehydrogenase [Spirochaetota bacterium]
MSTEIVFLDAATVDYGDLDFAPLEKLGSLAKYDITRPEDMQARLRGAAVAVTNKCIFDEGLMRNCPDLRLVAVTATGYNNIDIEAAARQGVAVANVPGYSTSSVAQFTMACMLALATRLVEYSAAARDGRWSRSTIYTLGTWPTFELEGKILGIMGMGSIGSEVARLAGAFGMRIIALGRDGVGYTGGWERVGLPEIAERSDVICIHLPLSPMSRGIINADFLSRMKRTAFLINMARGPIVDQAALDLALRSGRIAGAALDVLEQEPPPGNEPLLSAPNCIITPHIAWASVESRRRLIDEVAANIGAFLRGEARNRVT